MPDLKQGGQLNRELQIFGDLIQYDFSCPKAPEIQSRAI